MTTNKIRYAIVASTFMLGLVPNDSARSHNLCDSYNAQIGRNVYHVAKYVKVASSDKNFRRRPRIKHTTTQPEPTPTTPNVQTPPTAPRPNVVRFKRLAA